MSSAHGRIGSRQTPRGHAAGPPGRAPGVPTVRGGPTPSRSWPRCPGGRPCGSRPGGSACAVGIDARNSPAARTGSGSPAPRRPRLGSTRASGTTSIEAGFRSAVKSRPSASSPGFGSREQAVVEARLRGHRVGGRDPVDRPLDAPALASLAAAARGVVGASHLGDLAASARPSRRSCSGRCRRSGDAPRCPGTAGSTWAAAPRGRRRARSRGRARTAPCADAHGRVLGIVDRLELLHLPLRIVLDDEPDRPEHRHDTRARGDSDPPARSARGAPGRPRCWPSRRRCARRSPGSPPACSPGGGGRRGSASAGRPSRRTCPSWTSRSRRRLLITV